LTEKHSDGRDPSTSELERRLAEAESNLEALISQQIDAVLESGHTTPLLLRQAQATLQRSKDELQALVNERTAELEEINLRLMDELERRERLEAVLLESELRYQELVESLPVMVWTSLPDGSFDYLSPQWVRYTGRPELEQLGNGWLAQIHPDDQEVLLANWGEALATGQRYEGELRIRSANDNYCWFETQAVALYDEHGRIRRWFGACTDIQARREAEERLRQAQEQAFQIEIQHRLLEQRELERQVIARSLHDGPIQDLIALIYGLQGVLPGVSDPALVDNLRQIKESAQGLVGDLRNVCNELRPPTLVQFGLERAIRNHVHDLSRKTGRLPDIYLDLMEDGNRLSDSTRLGLYRIYQEAILNAIHHAQASLVIVRLTLSETEIVLEVEDDGLGFEVPYDWLKLARMGHLGFVGMKERAEAMGGDFAVISAPGKGLLLHVSAPLG